MPRRQTTMNADAFDHDLLLAYVEGGLDHEAAARLEAQLRQDPKLASLLSGMRADRDALRSLPREAAPATLALPVEQRLERTMLLEPVDEPEAEVVARVRPAWRRVVTGVAAAAVLAFGAAVTIVVMSGGDLMDTTLALFGQDDDTPETTAIAKDAETPSPDDTEGGESLAIADAEDRDAAERRAAGDRAREHIDPDGIREGGALAVLAPPAGPSGPSADAAEAGDAAEAEAVGAVGTGAPGAAMAAAEADDAESATGPAAGGPWFFTSLNDVTDVDVADDLALRVATACASDTQRDLVTWADRNDALLLVNDGTVVGYGTPGAQPARGWRVARPTDRWAADHTDDDAADHAADDTAAAAAAFEEPVFDHPADETDAAGGRAVTADPRGPRAEAGADAEPSPSPAPEPTAASKDVEVVTEQYLIIEAERLPEVLAHLNREQTVMQRAKLVPVEKVERGRAAGHAAANRLTEAETDPARMRELRRLQAELVMLEVAEDNFRQLGEELRAAKSGNLGDDDRGYAKDLPALRERIVQARAELDTQASAADAAIVRRPDRGLGLARVRETVTDEVVAGQDSTDFADGNREDPADGDPATADDALTGRVATPADGRRFDWGGVLAQQLPIVESEPIRVHADRRVVLKLVIEPFGKSKARDTATAARDTATAATRPAETQPAEASSVAH